MTTKWDSTETILTAKEVQGITESLVKDELDIGPIEAKLNAISKGDWVDDVNGDTGDLTVQMGDGTHNIYFSNMEGSCGECHANARFVANAPKDEAALIAEIKRQRAEMQSMFEDYIALRKWLDEQGIGY
jgi:hypothetical protein